MFSSFSIKKKQRRRAVSSASTRPHGHGTAVVAGGGRWPSVQWLQANSDGPKVMFIVRCLLVGCQILNADGRFLKREDYIASMCTP
jgi:hypothetical protein